MAIDRPGVFNQRLARSLDGLSNCLYNLGYLEEALDAIREAIELWRHLVENCPAAFNRALAESLHRLSIQLVNMGHLGHREDALEAIREVVELQRHLTAEQPAQFNPIRANSLHGLSIQLFNLGHRPEALEAAQEAVELRQQLADRPSVFDPQLANSLKLLSIGKSDGHHRVCQQYVGWPSMITAKCKSISQYNNGTVEMPCTCTVCRNAPLPSLIRCNCGACTPK